MLHSFVAGRFSQGPTLLAAEPHGFSCTRCFCEAIVIGIFRLQRNQYILSCFYYDVFAIVSPTHSIFLAVY